MTTPPPIDYKPKNDTSLKDQIKEDLIQKYKEILKIHLDGRAFKEDKVKFWLNNILTDAKEYFIKKYPNYDIFLFTQICDGQIYYRSNSNAILVTKTDAHDFADYKSDDFYCILRFAFMKHYNLDYNIEEYEDAIIQKGDEILRKYLEDRKFIHENADDNNIRINDEYVNFILEKEKYLRVFVISKIYKKPVPGKYYFKYLCHGKDIYTKIIQTYDNENLECVHFLFFLK